MVEEADSEENVVGGEHTVTFQDQATVCQVHDHQISLRHDHLHLPLRLFLMED